ncbi:hypothetical protein INR49_026810 [Caranx melampygus]|nr:hypothetical protein INR49_026810 [Caranx melampygus]
MPGDHQSQEDELKGKILLKAKKIGGLEKCPDETLTDEVSDDEEMANGDPDSPSAEDPPAECKNNKKSKSKLSRELSDLVLYCKSVHFHGFEHSRLHSKCYEMSSFSESKAKRLAKDAGTDFVQYNTRQLSRIYPSGLRTDSSNYNPQDMWSVGCQIVALNFQTAGLEMDLNDGLFRQNGGCGYVLKPDFVRDGSTQFSPEKPEERQGYRPLRLSIKVISGQQLPKVNQKEGSIVDPLVRVEIYGVPQDQAKEETSHINNNGFNPVWNETLNFIIHNPELALDTVTYICCLKMEQPFLPPPSSSTSASQSSHEEVKPVDEARVFCLTVYPFSYYCYFYGSSLFLHLCCRLIQCPLQSLLQGEASSLRVPQHPLLY